MKKILLTLLLAICATTMFAEISFYKATSYAYKYVDSDTDEWVDWTDWIDCNVKVSFNFDDDIIKIYSNEQQTYVITEYGDEEDDGQGGRMWSLDVVDQDGDKGTVRLRIEKGGNSELYVDFANVMWVYNVTSIN